MTAKEIRKVYELIHKVTLARDKVKTELQKLFPPGSQIEFFIMRGQKVPSTGIVTYHDGNGYVQVLHLQAKEYSRYRYRNVYFKNILSDTTRRAG